MAMRQPAEVFPPGEFLSEELKERGWTQTDLAEILGRQHRVVNEIILGKRAISPETAKGLAAALGTSPEFWLGLEAAYQLWRVKNDDDGDAVARRARLYSMFPIKDILRRGWLEPTESVESLEQQLLSFFAMRDFDDEPAFVVDDAGKSTSYSATTMAQAAWLCRAKKLAPAVHAGPFSQEKLKAAIRRLQLLLHAPQEVRHVPRILSEAGIKLILVEALPGTQIDGACFWDGASPVIVLAMRIDRIDRFWFTLMHEFGHILNRNGAGFVIDTDMEGMKSDRERPESEQLADEFALEQLVPQERMDSFVARIRPLYSAPRIEAFAEIIRVHPGIVVGQLQYRGEIVWSSFRAMLVPVRRWLSDSALTDGWDARLPARL